MAALKDVTKKAGGPQTPEGKAASAMNALKHGLSGNTVAVPGENPAIYEQILLDLRTGQDELFEGRGWEFHGGYKVSSSRSSL